MERGAYSPASFAASASTGALVCELLLRLDMLSALPMSIPGAVCEDIFAIEMVLGFGVLLGLNAKQSAFTRWREFDVWSDVDASRIGLEHRNLV